MAEGKLKDGLTWRLSDPGMGLLERAGLAALYMSLRAAEEQGMKDQLAPLNWNADDLTSETVTIRSAGTDKEALTKLFEWAWQVRDDVLYFPAVHRSKKAHEYLYLRIALHNGISRTFLQHPRVQPKGELVERSVSLDEGKQIKIAYQALDARKLKPLGDLNKAGFFDRSGVLSDENKLVELSGWVFPGIAPRFSNESAWSGPAHLGLLLMLAPIVCLYLQLHNQRSTWLFVLPDLYDLDEFDSVISGSHVFLDPAFRDVASIGDAGLQFLAEYSSQSARKELRTGCRVVAMGKVGYYPNQSVRRGIADVPPHAKIISRYRRLQQAMGNRWMQRKAVDNDDDEVTEIPKRKKAKKQNETQQPIHFVSVPTGRGRIADNLIAGHPWYSNLVEPLLWDRDSLDRLRKRRPGTSVERLWFQNLCYQRGKLMDLIQDNDMWDNPEERLFVEAFWELLGLLYIRERKAVERGGTRPYEQRCEDLNEEIRRILTRSKTGPLARQAMTDLMTRPFEMYRANPDDSPPTRSKTVRANPATIWRLIDRDWKLGRDLALLALASYQSKEKRGASISDETEPVEIAH